jgi:hypothetical protein
MQAATARFATRGRQAFKRGRRGACRRLRLGRRLRCPHVKLRFPSGLAVGGQSCGASLYGMLLGLEVFTGGRLRAGSRLRHGRRYRIPRLQEWAPLCAAVEGWIEGASFLRQVISAANSQALEAVGRLTIVSSTGLPRPIDGQRLKVYSFIIWRSAQADKLSMVLACRQCIWVVAVPSHNSSPAGGA